MTGLREYSSGVECPELTTPSTVMLQTPGGPQQVPWLFSEATPAPPEGRPLLMIFHGLGASAKTMIPRLQLQALADAGAVVAVPQGIRTARFGWGAGPKGIHDVMLVEDIRRCGYERLRVDLTRVHASGFSAGGLWTTLLMMHGSEILASAAVFSGGDLPPFVNYETPKIDVPALIIWGGETDAYRGRTRTRHPPSSPPPRSSSPPPTSITEEIHMIKADMGYMAQLLSDAESDASALIDEDLQIRVDLAQAEGLPFVVLRKP